MAAAGLIAVLNALVPRMIPSWSQGFWHALSDTFGVSAIVWLAIAVVFAIVLEAPEESASPSRQAGSADWLLAAIILALSLVPAPALAASAIVPLAGWALLTANGDAQLRRIGLILGALTLTLFWGPLALRVFPEVLAADAQLAAWFLGSEARGNIYSTVDGSKHFIVLSACSSVKNLSLATILAVTLCQYLKVRIDPRIGASILVASLGTVAVNVARLGIMASRPDEFEYWHGGFGATIFGYTSLAVVCFVVGFAIAHRLTHAKH